MGERLTLVLAWLGELLPETATELVGAPTRARLDPVAAGQLDAAFVRGVSSAKGVELIEVWQDRLLVVLPATRTNWPSMRSWASATWLSYRCGSCPGD